MYETVSVIMCKGGRKNYLPLFVNYSLNFKFHNLLGLVSSKPWCHIFPKSKTIDQ